MKKEKYSDTIYVKPYLHSANDPPSTPRYLLYMSCSKKNTPKKLNRQARSINKDEKKSFKKNKERKIFSTGA